MAPSRLHLRLMLPPLPGPLILEPGDDGRPVVSAVAPERDMWHPPGARLSTHPRLGHAQELSDLGSGEEAIAHRQSSSPGDSGDSAESGLLEAGSGEVT